MTQIRRKFLTRDDLKQLLIKRIKQSGLKPTQWAIMNGISATRVSFVLRDKEPPGPKLIKALGVDPTPHYPMSFKTKEQNDDAPDTIEQDEQTIENWIDTTDKTEPPE